MSEELASLEIQYESFRSVGEIGTIEDSGSSDEEEREYEYEDASFELGQIFTTLL